MDRRECILQKEAIKAGYASIEPLLIVDDEAKRIIFNAMDDRATEMCLELLEYIAKNKVICHSDKDGSYFNYRGETLTKEQLFDNFL